ncbi:hypothetical protein BGZ54_008336 [Gamsiella multidivaricata]|nr:hypothetical protein BGZ54_008336 [Gamsiella multidivaricata]
MAPNSTFDRNSRFDSHDQQDYGRAHTNDKHVQAEVRTPIGNTTVNVHDFGISNEPETARGMPDTTFQHQMPQNDPYLLRDGFDAAQIVSSTLRMKDIQLVKMTDLRQAYEKNATLSTKLHEIDTMRETLQEENSDLRFAKSNIEQEKRALDQEYGGCRTHLQDLEKERVESIVERHLDAKHTLETTTTKLDKCGAEVQTLKDALKTLKEERGWCDEYLGHVKELNEKVVIQNDKIAALVTDIEKKETLIRDLETACESSENELSMLSLAKDFECETLQSQVENCGYMHMERANLTKSNMKSISVGTSDDSATDSFTQLKEQIDLARKQLSQYQEQIKNLQSQLRAVGFERDNLQHRMESTQKKIATVENENGRLCTSLLESQSEINSVVRDCTMRFEEARKRDSVENENQAQKKLHQIHALEIQLEEKNKAMDGLTRAKNDDLIGSASLKTVMQLLEAEFGALRQEASTEKEKHEAISKEQEKRHQAVSNELEKRLREIQTLKEHVQQLERTKAYSLQQAGEGEHSIHESPMLLSEIIHEQSRNGSLNHLKNWSLVLSAPSGESSQITDFEQSSSQATVVERGKKRKNSAVVQEQATDGYDGQQGNTKRAARSPSKMYSSKAQAIETQTTQPALESREPMVAASSANLTLNEAIGSSESMDKKEDEDDINDFESSTPQPSRRLSQTSPTFGEIGLRETEMDFGAAVVFSVNPPSPLESDLGVDERESILQNWHTSESLMETNPSDIDAETFGKFEPVNMDHGIGMTFLGASPCSTSTNNYPAAQETDLTGPSSASRAGSYSGKPETSAKRGSSGRRLASGEAHRKSELYKTELCISVHTGLSCKYGDNCQFAHSAQELNHVARHPRYKTQLCISFQRNGYCKYHDRCTFIHHPEEARVSPPSGRRGSVHEKTTWSPTVTASASSSNVTMPAFVTNSKIERLRAMSDPGLAYNKILSHPEKADEAVPTSMALPLVALRTQQLPPPKGLPDMPIGIIEAGEPLGHVDRTALTLVPSIIRRRMLDITPPSEPISTAVPEALRYHQNASGFSSPSLMDYITTTNLPGLGAPGYGLNTVPTTASGFASTNTNLEWQFPIRSDSRNLWRENAKMDDDEEWASKLALYISTPQNDFEI